LVGRERIVHVFSRRVYCHWKSSYVATNGGYPRTKFAIPSFSFFRIPLSCSSEFPYFANYTTFLSPSEPLPRENSSSH
jgi:hypothetical protein